VGMLSGVARAQFTDVPKNHWAEESVRKLAGAGIVQGDPKKSTPAKPAYDGNRPVTRYELAVTLYRFVVYMDKAKKQPKSKMGVQLPKTGAEAVKRLVAEGYLPKTTPLAQKGETAVTANQMSDALAQVMTRLAENGSPITPESLRDIPKPRSVPGT